MKKLIKYFLFLKFSIIHPINGIEILKELVEVKRNLKNEHYKNIQLETKEEIFQKQFPGSNFFHIYNEELNGLQNILKKKYDEIKIKKFPSIERPYDNQYSVNNEFAILFYMISREIKPKIIIETGVAYGHSSSYILEAMKKNNYGKLYSIDYVFSPWQTKEKIGMIIPKNLRDRWHFEFGPSSKKLKKLLEKLGEIDIFIHDSLHTYQNMKFEFNTAWPYIKKDGFLFSDDVSENSAFMEFCNENNLSPLFIEFEKNNSSIFGGIVKKT